MVIFQRRLPRFELLAPETLEEALSFLARHQGEAKVIAGGTDLVPKLKGRTIAKPAFLIDLRKLSGLNYIQDDQRQGIRIGALTTLRTIENSALIEAKYRPLSMAAQSVGSVQVRNRGTIGGNICNAVPSADTAPALLVLEARLKLTSLKGERVVRIEDFFVGPNKTVVSPDEILTEIQLPNPPPQAKGLYLKLSPRSAMDLAVVGVAVLLDRQAELCKDVRIALGAVAPTPIRAKTAEVVLRGQKINQELIEKAASAAAQQSAPIDDHRASADYRREMVRALTQRAITLALST